MEFSMFDHVKLTCLDEALKHFDAGRSVIPCNGKIPVGSNWANAWNNRDALVAHFTANPLANLGLVMRAELADFEWDSPEQEQVFRELFDGIDLPRTPCFKSQKGEHYIFKAHLRLVELGKGVINVKDLGIRIGAAGKQAQSIIPPSRNDDGTIRQWTISFDECEPASLPEIVVDRILNLLMTPPKKPTSPRRPSSSTAAVAAMLAINIEDNNDGSLRLFTCACRAVEHGLSDDEAIAAIREVETARPFPAMWLDDEIRQRLRQAERKVERGSAIVTKPKIDVARNDLDKLTQETWKCITAANKPPRLYLFGSQPVRVESSIDEPIIRDLHSNEIRFHLAEWAHFCRTTAKGSIVCPPPMDIVNNVLATPDKPLPVLERIVEAPVFGADGTLQTAAGYHPASRTLFLPGDGFQVPAVPDEPSALEISDARDLIVQELLGDFPFVNESQKAHAVSLGLLFFARHLIDGPTPFHLIEKPSPGTGATLLVEMLAYLALGRLIAGMTEGQDEDEWRKRLTSKLRTSPPFVLFDNIGQKLESPAVASAITGRYWEDRILGSSHVAKFPVSCAWIGTGNNPRMSNEMMRRTIQIRLDARVDRPWLREGFRHPDLKGWVADNRSRLVWAALTLIRAWLCQGRPSGDMSLGMFENWARVMGGILKVAGVPGFLANRERFYEEADSEGSVLRDLLSVWWEERGRAPTRTAELMPIAEKNAPELLGVGTSQSQLVRLGKMLSDARDRVFDVSSGDSKVAIRIEAAAKKAGATVWQLTLAA
jgi:hypothetical protein